MFWDSNEFSFNIPTKYRDGEGKKYRGRGKVRQLRNLVIFDLLKSEIMENKIFALTGIRENKVKRSKREK